MKKIILIITAIMMSNMIVQAQCGWQLNSAYKNGVEPSLSKAKLDKAWEAIEESLEKDGCEKEKDAWLYRAIILQRIAATKKEKYQKLTSEPLKKAFESYQRVIDLDQENKILLKVLGNFDEFSTAFVTQADLYKDTAEIYENGNNTEMASQYYEKAFNYTETATAAFLLSTMPLAVRSSDTITKEDAKELYHKIFNEDLTVNSEVVYVETSEFLDDLNKFYGKTPLEDIQALGLQIGPMTQTLYPRLAQFAYRAGL
jgi:tetratricopeptide (TPR) repeat protein